MTEPFLGQICIYGFNFAPRGWALCNGQILPIAQNTALFSLLGTTYGGNGQTTFALPNLQGRWPTHQGQQSGLSAYVIGQTGGTESATLNVNNLAPHIHQLKAIDDDSNKGIPTGNTWSNAPNAQTNLYNNGTPAALMNPNIVQPTGGGQPFPILQPYLTLNYCIALQGIFPSRN
jgi:microcystin-dependent protein